MSYQRNEEVIRILLEGKLDQSADCIFINQHFAAVNEYFGRPFLLNCATITVSLLEKYMCNINQEQLVMSVHCL